MAKGTPSRMRFSEEQNALIREISAASSGALKEVDVVRLALDALGEYWNHHGKRLMLPLRFHETFSVVTLPMGKKSLILTERISSEPGARSARPQKAAR